MKVKVPFYLIKVNSGREGLEIVFSYNKKWYRLEWSKVPDSIRLNKNKYFIMKTH